MTDRQTRADIARAAVAKAKRAERKVAAYLRLHGWPDAERARPGWKSGDRESPDTGDTRDVPKLTWQVKSGATMSDLDIEKALADTMAQTIAAGNDYGILVLQRTGKSDVGKWWAYMSTRNIVALTTGSTPTGQSSAMDRAWRTQVNVVVDLLHQAGYGVPA